jgi:hypothetical protein
MAFFQYHMNVNTQTKKLKTSKKNKIFVEKVQIVFVHDCKNKIMYFFQTTNLKRSFDWLIIFH